MALTADAIVSTFRARHTQVDSTTAYRYLNAVDEEILLDLPARKTSRAVALVENQLEYALLESELRIWAVRYYLSGVAGEHKQLEMVSEEELYDSVSTFRDNDNGTPIYVATSANTTTGVFLISPTSDTDSLTVVDASNATPIVVETQTHGFSDGDVVYIQGVLGNTTANGRFYVSVTSATEFELYTDSDLSDAVAGVGSYTSGGVIAGPSKPMIILDVSARVTTDFSSTETLSAYPQLRDLYVDGMSRMFCKERAPEKYDFYNRIFLDRLADQQRLLISRLTKVHPKVEPIFTQRKTEWR